jgi:AraC family transcriptional regulator of adaptative response / DNA-3-methyladenine glycosylase II
MMMMKNVGKNGLYAAFKSKDARFDGHFFVCVSSTGVYCRPVCRAKQPKIENCTFYPTAAEAEKAGYRPCLLCRPELAPGTSITDASANLANRAARMLRENCGNRQSLEKFAGQLGYTVRHLRRAFTAEYNVTPIQYLQTCRLLLAKNLLTDTDLPILKVAITAGFGSLRRFNDLFKKHYNLSPTTLRKHKTKEKKHDHSITLTLGYRPPYLWEKMLNFLAGRAITGIETVKNSEYMRTVHLENAEGKHIFGWVRVGQKTQLNALTVTMSETLLSVLPQVLARIRQQFDLHCDPDAVYEILASMNKIRPGLCVAGTRLPGCFNTFEMAVRAVLGQQITVKAASTLAARIVNTYGTPIQTEIEGLTHIFPSPKDILTLDGTIENRFGNLGIIASRSRTIYELARALEEKKINFDLCTQPEEEMKKLMTIRGIGNWTAQYIAMRAMEWTDAFLETDAGVKKALPTFTSKELLEMAKAWRPWRSYATINLWNTL